MPDSAAVLGALRERVYLLPFMRRWLLEAFSPDNEVAALSLPRGNGKTWLLGQLGALGLTPGSPTWERGIDQVVLSGSMEQSRELLTFVRAALPSEDDYSFLTAGPRLAVTHKPSGTRLRVISSSSKRALGLSNYSTIYADEPGAWELREGSAMAAALETSLGKREGQRLLMIGTRAPSPPDGWWPEFLSGGSSDGVHVELIAAPADEPWDAWPTIRKVNPMVNCSATLRRRILRERERGRKSDLDRRRFEAFRLNRLTDVARTSLLSVQDYKTMIAREAPDRTGRPILGIDAGAVSSWTAGVLVWPNGRVEALAMVGGAKPLADREREDGVRSGLYRHLHDRGSLIVDPGKHHPRLGVLVKVLRERGVWPPATIVADTFRTGNLRDAIGRVPLLVRRQRWSESSEDIGHLRRLVLDGPPKLSVSPCSRDLLKHSLAAASIESDTSGNVRIIKRRRTARDDVAVALTVAAGVLGRRPPGPPRPGRVLVG